MKIQRNSSKFLHRMVCVLVVALLAAATTLSVYATNTQGAIASEQSVAASVALSASAKAYALLDGQTGKLIAGKQEHERLPMASTTKIMTALITLEQPNIDEYFTVDSDAIRIEGSSMGLLEGDQASLRMLAYGMLLPSGNDAAGAAAVRIAGSLPAFADLMNQKAAEIGMTNSHFVTPSGLHHDEHYSTAYDMALLGRVALENADFAQICSASKAKVSFGGPPFDRWLSNRNKLLSFYDGCVGIKTGYTKKAGRCLVSAAKRESGGYFICTTLNAPNYWVDHTLLLDYGFSKLHTIELTPELPPIELPVVGSPSQSIGVQAVGSRTLQTTIEPSEVTQQLLYDPFVYAPIQEGDFLGRLEFKVGETVLATLPLMASSSAYVTVPPKSFKLNPFPALWDFLTKWFRTEPTEGKNISTT